MRSNFYLFMIAIAIYFLTVQALENPTDNSTDHQLQSNDSLITADSFATQLELKNKELESLLRKLSTRFANNEGSFEPSRLTISALIRDQRYELAQTYLRQFKSFDDIAFIVKAAYAKEASNFDAIVNFIEILEDIDLIYVSVDALRREMTANGQTNPLNFIRLLNILQSKSGVETEVESETKYFRQLCNEMLKESIQFYSIDVLNIAIRNGTLDLDIDNLTTAIYNYDLFEWEEIMFEFMDSNTDDASKIFDMIASQSWIEKKLRGVAELYWSLKFNHITESKVITNIASLLKDLQENIEFQKLNSSLSLLADEVIADLPSCVRNIVFLPSGSVCFWNVGAQAYLAILNSTNGNDVKSRRVGVSNNVDEGALWGVKREEDDSFVILSESECCREEEIVAVRTSARSPNRSVFTKIAEKKKPVGPRKWKIKLDEDDDDDCYLVSAPLSDHFLMASMTSRRAFTNRINSREESVQFKWQVRNCAN